VGADWGLAAAAAGWVVAGWGLEAAADLGSEAAAGLGLEAAVGWGLKAVVGLLRVVEGWAAAL
jgi:hypothetical protein